MLKASIAVNKIFSSEEERLAVDSERRLMGEKDWLENALALAFQYGCGLYPRNPVKYVTEYLDELVRSNLIYRGEVHKHIGSSCSWEVLVATSPLDMYKFEVSVG